MTPSLPYGAREVEQLRRIGKRPAHMLLVSLIGALREHNPVIVAKPGVAYDWRFALDLDVLVVADSTIEKRLVKRTLDALALVQPGYLGLWLADSQDGQHVCWGSYRPKALTMRRFGIADKRDMEGLGQWK